jgi:hypothetical protein
MATDAAPFGEAHPHGNRTMAQLRTAHHPWTQAGKPANLKRHTLWVYGQKFEVLEDEIGVVAVTRHQAAD